MEKKFFGVIYCLENLLNHKCYVGQTRNLPRRLKEHRRNKKTAIGRAIQKHGWENFKVTVLAECESQDELNEREKFWIDNLNTMSPNGYNIAEGGEKKFGFSQTDEGRKKISDNNKGQRRQPHSAATKAKISANSPCKKAIICIETGEVVESIISATKKYSASRSGIGIACRNLKKTAGGKHWAYFDKNFDNARLEELRAKIAAADEERKVAKEKKAAEARAKAEREAEKKKIAEEKKVAEARAKAERAAEKKKIAEEKRAAKTREKAERAAEKKRIAEEKKAAKARAKAEREAEKKKVAKKRTPAKDRAKMIKVDGKWKHSAETLAKMRGNHLTLETRAKMSANHPGKRRVRCIETGEIFESLTAATKKYGSITTTISKACRNSKRTAAGKHWEYVD